MGITYGLGIMRSARFGIVYQKVLGPPTFFPSQRTNVGTCWLVVRLQKMANGCNKSTKDTDLNVIFIPLTAIGNASFRPQKFSEQITFFSHVASG